MPATTPYATAAHLPPGVTTISATRLRKLLDDEAICDFVDRQGNGDFWIARHSSTGRGYRVHNTTSGDGAATFRGAVTDAMEQEPK